MGCYINPPDKSKEKWLEENGTVVGTPVFDPSLETLPVCLVSNGFFTAAAICFSEAEMMEFNDPEDRRPKLWYRVSRPKLHAIAPDLVHFIK